MGQLTDDAKALADVLNAISSMAHGGGVIPGVLSLIGPVETLSGINLAALKAGAADPAERVNAEMAFAAELNLQNAKVEDAIKLADSSLEAAIAIVQEYADAVQKTISLVQSLKAQLGPQPAPAPQP